MRLEKLHTLLTVATLSLAASTLAWSGRLVADDTKRAKLDVDQLVAALGHDDWNTREEAQQQLLELKDTVLPALRSAVQSESPEIAERAQFLLDVIDPIGVTLRITRIALGEEPKIIDVLQDTSTGTNEVRLAASGTKATASNTNKLEYRLRFRLNPEGMALNAELVPGSGQAWPLFKEFLATPGPVTLIDYGRDAAYLQIGSHIERRERPYISIVEWNMARRSERKQSGTLTTDSGNDGFRSTDDLDSLRDHLRKQTGHKELATQLNAITILGLLRDSETADLIQPYLEDSQTRFVTLLALARIGDEQALDSLREHLLASLEDSAEDTIFPGDETVTRDSFALTEAAITLLEHGDAIALGHLTSKLGKLDQTEFHQVLAAITSYLESDHGKRGEHDRDLLRALMRKDVITTFSWRDAEVVYLYMRALDLISAGENTTASEFLDTLGNTVIEDRESYNAAELKSLLTLWQRLSRSNDLRNVLFEFVDTVLAGTRDTSLLAQLAACVGAASRSTEVSEAEFDLIRETILTQLEGANTQTVNSKVRFLVQFAQQVQVTASRRTALVALLWDVAQRRSSIRTDLLNEIVRQTGVEPTTPTGPANDPSKATRIIQPRRLSLNTLRDPVEAWLAEPGNEQANEPGDTESPPAAPAEESPSLQFIELDVVYGMDGTAEWLAESPGNDPKKSDSHLHILDGRLLNVADGAPFQYTDRWGNFVASRLDSQQGHGGATHRRYRMEGEQTLTANTPQLRTPRQRTTNVHLYRYSSSETANYRISLARAVQMQTVTLVHEPNPETKQPTFTFAQSATPDELWAQFRNAFIARLEKTDVRQLNQQLRIIESLKLQQAIPVLRKRFETLPDYQLASTLLRMGDRSSVPFMREQLETPDGKPKRRFAQFAQVLTENGDRKGFTALVEYLQNDKSGSHVYQSLSALEKFLEFHSPTEEEIMKTLHLLFTKLGDARYQSRGFNILRRELGTDFGFSDTWRIGGGTNARKQAQHAVVQEAVNWWNSQGHDVEVPKPPTPEQGTRGAPRGPKTPQRSKSGKLKRDKR